MKIKNITLNCLTIPFKETFSHSSASRSETETVWVEVNTDKGVVGYGEGCPRDYVTNETLLTAIKFFDNFKYSIVSDIQSVDSLIKWVNSHSDRIDQHPAAWCAIELAVLDALGKEHNRSIEELLALPELKGTFRYSAVLGDSDERRFALLLQQYYVQGFRDFKVKLSGTLSHDRAKLALFRSLADKEVKVRLDANNLWNNQTETENYLLALDCPVWAIEEPLVNADYTAMASVSRSLQKLVILDESFLRVQQLEYLTEPEPWVINLRISKMGGLIRSRTVAEAAQERNIPLIVGSQVGETSVLTRAGLTIANAFSKNVLAQEGAFGTWLLKTDVATTPLMIESDGQLKWSNAKTQGGGLGLTFSFQDDDLLIRRLASIDQCN